MDHPKLMRAAALLGRCGYARAFALYVQGLCYANRNLTDGYLPREAVKQFLGSHPLRVATVLASKDVRLWEPVPQGFRIHDYAVYNPSAFDQKIARDWDKRRKHLYTNPALILAIRQRDGKQCRYCGVTVSWTNRRGPAGATYDHVIPHGPNSLENIVVSCFRCNTAKGHRTPEEWGRPLLAPPGTSSRTSSDLVRIKSDPDPDPSTKTDLAISPGTDLSDPGTLSGDLDHCASRRNSDHDQTHDRRGDILVRLAHDVLSLSTESLSDRFEELKRRAAHAHIPYDSDRIRQALEAAEVQRRKRQ